jgi:uncharacterized protein (DUF58 family)
LRQARRVASALTPTGRAVLALALLSGWAGTRLHWAELTTLGIVCGVALALAVPQVVRPRPASVHLRLMPRTTVAGRPATAAVGVEAGGLRLVNPVLTVPLAGSVTSVRLPSVGARSQHTERFDIPAPHRGVYVVGPVTHEVSDLLGLVRRRVRWAHAVELLVRPQTVLLDSFSPGVVSDLDGAPSEQLSASDLAFHALREYTPGDDLRHVHWRSSARTGTLLVRQYLETTRSHATVVLDDDPASYSGVAEFELAVSVAVSIALRAILDDFDVTWVSGDTVTETREPDVLLDRSCRLTAAGSDIVDASRRNASGDVGTSVVAIVSGGRGEQAPLRLAASAFGEDARRVLVRADNRRDSRLDEIDGMRVVSVSELDHLTHLLSRHVR